MMTLVNRAGTTKAVLVAAAAFVLLACQDDGRPRPPSQEQLIAEATSNYTYDSSRGPVSVDTTRVGGPGGTLPAITIATAHRTSATGRASSRFIGRLTSTAAYPRLRLAPGDNYVWTDSLGKGADKVRFLIVPANTSYHMFFVRQEADNTPLDSGSSPLPRLVKSAVAYALCDGGCNGGHCIMREATIAYADPDDTTVIMAAP